MTRRSSFVLAILAAGCVPPTSPEPGVPRLTGADLGRACAAWADEPSRLSTKRPHRARSIFSGPDFACATVDDGRALCWGWNEDGRLVGGDREFLGRPAFLRGISDVAQVDDRCARTAHGTVYCWDAGPLDAGGRRLISDFLRPLERARIRRAGAPCGPVRVPDIDDAVDLDVGDEFACALQTNGRVSCWGNNERAQLGRLTGDPEGESMPRPIPHLEGVRDLATGARHACALLKGGRVMCWGDNENGQLGFEGPRFSGRPQLVPRLDRIVEIDAAGEHTCARRRDGTALCWGKVGFIQGDGRENAGVCDPTEVPGLEDAVELGAGGFDCARRWGGKVVCWSELNCGFGEKSDRYGSGKPVRVPQLDRTLELSVGGEHACARRRGGRVWCWGEARSGGLGSHAPQLPTTSELEQVPAFADAIGGARDTICGLDRKKRVVCSKLSSTPPHAEPRRLEGLDEPVVELVHAPLLDCARTKSGKVACWGSEERVLPVTELGEIDHIYPLWSSAACAHRSEGGTSCWGAEVTSIHSATGGDSTGEDDVEHWHAEVVDTPVDVIEMVLDRESVCGITADESVVCWPLAASDDPLTFSRLALQPSGPTDPAGPSKDAAAALPTERRTVDVEARDVVEITAASRGFCARTETGEILCWQVDPERDAPITPVPVGDLVGVLDWGRGALSSELCAVTGDGGVHCWSPAFDPKAPPSTIEATRLDLDGAKSLIRLGAHPCVLRENGSLYCWGGPFRGAPLSRDEGLFVPQPVPIGGLRRPR